MSEQTLTHSSHFSSEGLTGTDPQNWRASVPAPPGSLRREQPSYQLSRQSHGVHPPQGPCHLISPGRPGGGCEQLESSSTPSQSSTPPLIFLVSSAFILSLFLFITLLRGLSILLLISKIQYLSLLNLFIIYLLLYIWCALYFLSFHLFGFILLIYFF